MYAAVSLPGAPLIIIKLTGPICSMFRTGCDIYWLYFVKGIREIGSDDWHFQYLFWAMGGALKL